MAGIFGARPRGVYPNFQMPDPMGKALISGIPLAPNTTTATTDPSQASPMLANAAPQWKKPSTLQTIAGVIGDSLSQWSGGQALFGQTQALRQKAMYDAAMAQQERANKFSDWQQQYDYEAGHPKGSDLSQRVADLNGLKPGLGDTYAQNYALYGGSQPMPQIVTTPQGTFMVPRAGVTTPPSGGPQPGTVDGGFRFKGGNPADQSNWEPVGGPTPSASGTFR